MDHFHKKYDKEEKRLRLQLRHRISPNQMTEDDKLAQFYFFMICSAEEFEIHQQSFKHQIKYNHHNSPCVEGYIMAIESIMNDPESDWFTRHQMWHSLWPRKQQKLEMKLWTWKMCYNITLIIT